jgi:TP901 family phage tail tape measure protein
MALDKQKLILELRTRGITLTKAQLKQLDAQVGRSKVGMKMMGGAMIAATAAIAAAGAAFISVVKIGKEFEQSMANLKAISGATGSQMLKLESTARKLGATTKFTASEVGGLQTSFAKLGFTVSEIEGATKATLDLAAATGAELAESASVAGETVRAFGLAANDTADVTDVMALSFSRSALDMQKFTDSMSYVAPVAKMAGFGVEETTAILGTLANAGVSGSMAGTALRRVFLELSNESSKLSQRLGGSITSVEDLVPALERLKEEGISTAEMKDLVGQRAISAFSILLDGTDTLGKLSESFESAGGAAERMARVQLDTLEGKLTILNSAWEGFAVAAYDYFEEPLKSATEALTSFLGRMTDVIDIPLSKKIKENQVELNALTSSLKKNIDEEEQRKIILTKLDKDYPEFLKKLNQEALTIEDINKALKEANKTYEKRIQLAIQEQFIQDAAEELTDSYYKQVDAQVSVHKNLQAMSDITGVAIDNSKSLRENLDMQRDAHSDLSQKVGLFGKAQKELDEINKRTGESHTKIIYHLDSLRTNYMSGVHSLKQFKDAEVEANEALETKSSHMEILNKLFSDYGINIDGSTSSVEEFNKKVNDAILDKEELDKLYASGAESVLSDEDESTEISQDEQTRLDNIDQAESDLADRRSEWHSQRMADLIKEAEQLSFSAEQQLKVYKMNEDGNIQAHEFSMQEIDLIAQKMDAGLSYAEAVKAALLNVKGVQIFTEENNEIEFENMMTNMENVEMYVEGVSELLDQFAATNVMRSRQDAEKKIKHLNAEQAKELKYLKASEDYKRASDTSKLQMEEELIKGYDKQRKKEEKEVNEKLKKQHVIQQLASQAQIGMLAAEAVMRNVKEQNWVGVAFAVATAVAQTAAVWAQQPPTMQEGGLIGGKLHSQGGTMVEAERGEYVVNRAAVENMGVEELDRINQGGGGQMVVNISGNVMSDEFVADEIVPKLREAVRRGGDITA